MHERRVADLLRMAQERGGHLRVEQGMRQHAHLTQQDLQILVACMEQLHDVLVAQHGREYLQIVDGERIDVGRLIVGRELDQA